MSNAHVRMGWGRREAIVDAPVGFDGYSYGLKDTDCEKLHLSRRKPYGDKGRHLMKGDVIGCLIDLPPRSDDIKRRMQDPNDRASIKRVRPALRFKGQMYVESDEYKPIKEMEEMVDREGKHAKAAQEAAKLAAIGDTAGDDKENTNGSGGGAKVLKGGKTKQTTKSKGKAKATADEADTTRKLATLPGSSISFFLNGQSISHEPAFEDLFDFTPPPPTASSLAASAGKKGEPPKGMLHDDGTLGYYPMVSVFGRGKLRVNFGPDWLKPPTDSDQLESVRPMCERWDEFREEERIQDEKDELERLEIHAKQEKEEEARREAIMKRKLAADARKVKKGTPSSRGGGVKGKGSVTGTGTPRSRLGTSVTPGPMADLSSDQITPSSPSAVENHEDVKMEVDSVMGESRGTSPIPKREPSSEDLRDNGEMGRDAVDHQRRNGARDPDSGSDSDSEEENTLFD